MLLTLSNAPGVLNGLARHTMFFSSRVDKISPITSETMTEIPTFRDFLNIIRIIAAVIHIIPPLPKKVIIGMTKSRNGLRMPCIAFKIKKSICVIMLSPLLFFCDYTIFSSICKPAQISAWRGADNIKIKSHLVQ